MSEELQLTKERLFTQAASIMSAEKILIVCDRGVMDNRAYMSDDEFEVTHTSQPELQVKY